MPKSKRPSRFRLDPSVRPTDYNLRIEPDLDAGTFRGEVRIALQLAKPRSEITLHAADLEVTRAVVVTNGGEEPARVKRRAEDEAVTIVARRKLSGTPIIELSYRGRLG